MEGRAVALDSNPGAPWLHESSAAVRPAAHLALNGIAPLIRASASSSLSDVLVPPLVETNGRKVLNTAATRCHLWVFGGDAP